MEDASAEHAEGREGFEKMKGRIKDMGLTLGGDLSLTLTLPRTGIEDLKKLKDAEISVEIKKWSDKRSLSANGLCWALCRDIGKAMGLSDIDVYKMAVAADETGTLCLEMEASADAVCAADPYHLDAAQLAFDLAVSFAAVEP